MFIMVVFYLELCYTKLKTAVSNSVLLATERLNSYEIKSIKSMKK